MPPKPKPGAALNISPLLSVRDVEASSAWYQQLLQLKSAHGGREYDRLEWAGEVVLHLHRWDVDHHHGPFGDVKGTPYGNGVALWVETEDFDGAVARADAMGATVTRARGPGGNTNWELWLRDPDGYLVVLESPHGSAA